MIFPDGLGTGLQRGLLVDSYGRFSMQLTDTAEREKRGKETISAPASYTIKFKELAYINISEESPTQAKVQSICQDGTLLRTIIADDSKRYDNRDQAIA